MRVSKRKLKKLAAKNPTQKMYAEFFSYSKGISRSYGVVGTLAELVQISKDYKKIWIY